MTTPTPNIPSPGAESANDWPTHRVFSADQRHIMLVAPDYNGANGLNSDQARELAASLLAAADELDGWIAPRVELHRPRRP